MSYRSCSVMSITASHFSNPSSTSRSRYCESPSRSNNSPRSVIYTETQSPGWKPPSNKRFPQMASQMPNPPTFFAVTFRCSTNNLLTSFQERRPIKMYFGRQRSSCRCCRNAVDVFEQVQIITKSLRLIFCRIEAYSQLSLSNKSNGKGGGFSPKVAKA